MRIVVMPPFDKEFFARRCDELGRIEVEPVVNLFALVDRLDALAPGFGAIAKPRVHFAADGVLETDWARPLSGAKEVIVLARVGGG